MDAAQQYNTNGRGYSPLLEWAKQHTHKLQSPPAGQEVVITSGSNHAIDVSIRRWPSAHIPQMRMYMQWRMHSAQVHQDMVQIIKHMVIKVSAVVP